jgi:hypothetical protein
LKSALERDGRSFIEEVGERGYRFEPHWPTALGSSGSASTEAHRHGGTSAPKDVTPN